VSSPLLTTKLYIPPIRSELVSRPLLVERLNAGLFGQSSRFARKLTLISAPAGFGKTTLVAQWVRDIGHPVAWLSLDEGDSDPARFFTYLVAALQTVESNIGQAAQAMMQTPQPPPPETVLTSLINDIAATHRPFMLVLDDYHLISALPIHQQIGFLLEHQPPHMHLVVATREDPPLPLSRLRARGQLVDVRQTDLRFTDKEAAEFLRQVMQLELSSVQMSALHRRTEGWIAGLQLVALSMQGSADVQGLVESFTGSHRYVLDYLVDEVFRRQPAGVQDFLLKTSILDRFSAPLCDAVAERDDSQDVLLNLEHANLFIVPLDQSRQWYRYHRLFADLLRHRLDTVTDEATSLHKRACRWYADNGFPADAVYHALAASDWETAASLIIESSGELLKRGQVVTLLGWLQALPEEIVLADPQLCLEYVWPLILTEQIDAAEPYLNRVEQAAEQQGDTSTLAAVAVAHVHIARMRGDNQRAAELSEQALALLPPDELVSRSVVALNLGMSQWYRGRLDEAERTLTEAERAGRGSRNHYVRFAALAFLGRVHTTRGRSRKAAAFCQQIVEEGGQSPIVAVGHYDLARLLYEQNDLETAVEHLEQGIELSRRGSAAEFTAGGYGTLALVKQAQGDAVAARDALRQTEPLLDQADISPATRLRILIARILVALGQDDLDAAALAAGQAPQLEESGSFPDYLSLMLAQARLLLTQGKQAAAAQHLATLHGMASQAGWQSIVTQTRALQALAAPTPDEAFAFLTEALTGAEPEGYVRTFVDAGEPMAELLRQAAARGITPGYVSRLLAAFEGETEGERPMTEVPPPSFATRPSPLVEPLSDRELEVLYLLSDGQTNQEVARTLCISINTVKSHLKNIYGKLVVRSRRQATAKAKDLGLLS
jgi:LuxR family maltose regulon positive regulatory protein